MATHPNILLIISDDHRHSALHGFGEPAVQTPVLDRLAADGVAMRRAHIMGGMTGAVCIPARACLHTGAHVFRCSVGHSVEAGRALSTLNPELALLGETLRAAGYQTFATGKWHNDRASFARSFEGAARIFFGGMCDHDKVPLHDFDPTGAYPPEQAYIGEGFSSELFADAAVDFLTNHADGRPFFLYLAFTAPHDPRTPPPEYAALYDPAAIPLPPNFLPEHPFDNGELRVRDEQLAPWPRTPEVIRQHMADYYGMISHMDAQIGRVLDALDQAGHADNTLVVYLADHGLAVGQHGLMGKQNLYDHSIRVPLILRGPGVPAGRQVNELVYSYDLFPTLCELVGLPIPPTVDSRSFAGLVQGRETSGRETVFAVYKDVQRMVSDGRWKLIRYYRAHERGVGEDRLQLFHLAEDPWETQDLAGQSAYRHELERLAQALADWMQAVGDPLAAVPVLPNSP